LKLSTGLVHELFNLFGTDSSLIRDNFRHKELFEHIIIPYFRGISTNTGIALLENCKSILD